MSVFKYRKLLGGFLRGVFQIFAGGWRHPPIAATTGRCLTDRYVAHGAKIWNTPFLRVNF